MVFSELINTYIFTETVYLNCIKSKKDQVISEHKFPYALYFSIVLCSLSFYSDFTAVSTRLELFAALRNSRENGVGISGALRNRMCMPVSCKLFNAAAEYLQAKIVGETLSFPYIHKCCSASYWGRLCVLRFRILR